MTKKEKNRRYYISHKKAILETHRLYKNSPDGKAKCAQLQKDYCKTEKGKEAFRRSYLKQISTEAGRLKYRARYALNNAIQSGRIAKLPCQVCGDEKAQAHHNDYSKPLEVWWFCDKHHKELHRRNTCRL